jgi:hypothetical protein
MHSAILKTQLKFIYVHDIKASLSSSLITINLWPCELYNEPYFLHTSSTGVVTLNNCNEFSWQLSDYLGHISIFYPDTTLN